MSGLNFTKQIDDDLKKLGAKASNAVTASVKKAWRTAVDATPRDTGTAQAGWKISTSRRSSYVPVRRVKPRPKVPNFRFRITKDKRIYFWNNVPYISFLEYGEGPGNRSPLYMMRRALRVLENELQRRLSNIK